jgi:hypothetical protein
MDGVMDFHDGPSLAMGLVAPPRRSQGERYCFNITPAPENWRVEDMARILDSRIKNCLKLWLANLIYILSGRPEQQGNRRKALNRPGDRQGSSAKHLPQTRCQGPHRSPD